MAERSEMLGRFLEDEDSTNAAVINLEARQVAPLHRRSGDDAGNSRHSPRNRTPRAFSSTSSASSYPQSEASSTKTVASSATSLSDSPPLQPQAVLNNPIATPPPPYTLPCLMECDIAWHPADFNLWHTHSLSHFGPLPPPPKSMCVFCDDENAIFENPANPREAWQRRMRHIQGHLRDLVRPEFAKPDFLVINYLGENKLLSEPEYSHAVEYTERPFCKGLVPNNFMTPQMLMEKERSGREFVDLEKEKRQILRQGKQNRKSKGQGHGKAAHRSSHKS